jgi:hypothetical protein
VFHRDEMPKCDLAIFIKHAPPHDVMDAVARHARVIYCPIDYYGSARDIDADASMLRRCSRIVIHCERLRKYFEPYAPVDYMDHHVKFATTMREQFQPDGYVLWVGVRSNLPALIQWVNRHPLPCELRILTNLEDSCDGNTPDASREMVPPTTYKRRTALPNTPDASREIIPPATYQAAHPLFFTSRSISPGAPGPIEHHKQNCCTVI